MSKRKEKPKKTRVYCGPSVKHVCKQDTVFTGELPSALQDFLKAVPIAKALIVPLDRFAQTRRSVQEEGTAENIIFQKVRQEIAGQKNFTGGSTYVEL